MRSKVNSFSYTELDRLAGELLPERAVLSALMGGGGDSYNNNNSHGHYGEQPGTFTAVNVCQSNVTRPDDGLLEIVGLHAQHDASLFVCQPGTANSGH
jgi:hypothetical protein